MNGPTQPPARNGNSAGIEEADIHKPFTPGERIQQLSEVDKDITTLLVHLSSAMRALATPPGTAVSQQPPLATTTSATNGHTPSDILLLDSDNPDPQPETDPLRAFQKAQSAFFQTVDRIDKQLTRQILALEEAGIITLRNSGEQQAQAQGGGGEQQPGGTGQQAQQQQQGGGEARRAGTVVKLEPDGLGRYGQLEVGQLNLASSTVERDMEAELWRRAREEMGKIAGEGSGGEGDRMEE